MLPFQYFRSSPNGLRLTGRCVHVQATWTGTNRWVGTNVKQAAVLTFLYFRPPGFDIFSLTFRPNPVCPFGDQTVISGEKIYFTFVFVPFYSKAGA